LKQKTLRIRKALVNVRLAFHKEETLLAVSQPKRAPGLNDPEQEKAGETKGELELL
jgi:hypothetical protein